MAKETEIKLRITDVPAFHRALKRIGARPVGPGTTSKVHEENVIFDTPQGGLAKHGQLLRIRTETPEARGKSKKSAPKQRVILTFKQPMTRPAVAETESRSDGPYKVRDEIEVEVAESANLARIFEGLGMSGWFRYEKYRTTYRLPASKGWAKGLLIELDETPIGTFVELEGPAEAIDRAAEELGYSKRDYVLKNYLRLYMEDCRRRGEGPRHMLFPKRK
jgi:adenylate cyclase class 2